MSAMTGVASRDAIEVVDGQRDAELVGDGQQVEHRIGGAAGRGDGRDGVLDRLAGDDAAGADVASHQVHDQLAAAGTRPSGLAGSVAGMPLSPAGERPRNSSTMDIVLAVYWPPHAPGAGARRRLDLVQLVEA